MSVPGDPERPFAFRPADISVPAGRTVRWVNDEAVFHTVTSTNSLELKRPNGLFDRSVFARGQAVEYRFTRPGIYHYYCRPHADFMFGTVRVTAQGAGERQAPEAAADGGGLPTDVGASDEGAVHDH